MTTQATATASDPEDKQAAELAQQVQEAQADVAKADAEATKAKEKPQGEPPYLTRDDLREVLNREQGQARQWYGNQFKREIETIRSEFRKELETTLSPFKQAAADFEQQRVAQLDPDAQIEYWRQKAQKPATIAEPQPQAQPQQTTHLTNEEQIALAASVRGFAKAQGVNVNVTDPRIWDGWSQDQSVSELEALAFANVQKIKGPAKAAPQPNGARPAATVVPSTRSAPKRPTAEFNSRQELSEALVSGQINSDQYREGLKKLGR